MWAVSYKAGPINLQSRTTLQSNNSLSLPCLIGRWTLISVLWVEVSILQGKTSPFQVVLRVKIATPSPLSFVRRRFQDLALIQIDILSWREKFSHDAYRMQK